MFKKNGHGFCCCCDMCKLKRKTSLWYMGSLFAFLIIVIYQTLLLIIFTTRINAIILLVLLLWVIIGFARILF